MTQKIIIVGASSAIAIALSQQLSEQSDMHIFAISRKMPNSKLVSDNISWIETDHTPSHINDILQSIAQSEGQITRVFICTGLLHAQDISPEKKIEQFSEYHFNQIMRVNVIIPTMWLQQLINVCNQSARCVITVFSARVGSISDNHLGGWYSYRMSKAALNMMLKTASVEYARRAKNTKLVAFHPGTTDTPLSKPFQANVPEEKLFTPQFVASQLLRIIDGVDLDGKVEFIDWQNKNVPW